MLNEEKKAKVSSTVTPLTSSFTFRPVGDKWAHPAVTPYRFFILPLEGDNSGRTPAIGFSGVRPTPHCYHRTPVHSRKSGLKTIEIFI
jgi:hypothetical protein